MAGDEGHAFGLDGVIAAHHGVDIGEGGRLGHAFANGLDEGVAMDFKAAATVFGDLLKLAGNPVSGGEDALAGRQFFFHTGMGAAIAETNQRFYRLFNVRGLDGFERTDDGRVGRGRGNGFCAGEKIWLGSLSDANCAEKGGYQGQADRKAREGTGEIHGELSFVGSFEKHVGALPLDLSPVSPKE